MKDILLNSSWKLTETDPQPDAPEKTVVPDFQTKEVMISELPADINSTLLKYGRIPHPHYDTRAKECYWVTSREWWYRLDFDLPEIDLEKNSDLCLEGVDGHADIWVNNHYLGTMKNSFRLFRFNITSILKSTENNITIRFKSFDTLLGGPRFAEMCAWQGRRGFLRKAMYTTGWDWAPPLPSLGLTGNVRLEHDNACRFLDLSIQTFVSGRVDFKFEVSDAAYQQGYEIIVKVNGHGKELCQTISRPTHKSYTTMEIPDPELWFPNGYGEPALYNYTAELRIDNQIIDCRHGTFGLRESRIKESPFTPNAGPGIAFEIELNGIPIFCKGANWVPLELWPADIKPEQYEFYLRKAKEANFNMLRVWGGGIYEPQLFYDLCDELGIMVWQDFMFASSGYPLELLRNEIIAEADYQLRRLRNHPSIVIWCGCNEDVFSWSYKNQSENSEQGDSVITPDQEDNWEVDRVQEDPQLYSMILRGLTGLLGNGIPYLESSPQSHDDYGNMPNSGNCHISCWKYALFESDEKPRRFREHFEQVCSFNSEFCIQGPCSVESLKRFMAPENHWPPNESWTYHIQRGHGNLPHHEQTLYIAGDIFGEIDSLETYTKYGQATHIEMMRCEFESARRDRPNNGGTMVWMFNDCWPTSNWSIIDYYRQPKPSYYAAKRACAPLLPIIFERAGNIEFFFSNESANDQEICLEYGEDTLEGNNVWAKKENFKVATNSVCKFARIAREKLNLTTGNFLYISATANGRQLPQTTYFPDGWRNITWPQPQVKAKIISCSSTEKSWITELSLITDRYARICNLSITGNSRNNIWFSDNFFDLTPRHERKISVHSDQQFREDELSIKTF